MCGITGAVSWDADLPVTRERLARMASHLAHRGPDGQDVRVIDGAPSVGMAFCRLAVIDPDPRAMQPMSTPDGRYTLVFNGEIYNFRDLRAELSPREWRTQSDTEVLLHALATWGESAIEKLNGMFAFALWDAQGKSLLLARDRMGQKPLYFTTGRRSVAFASELRALSAWPDWDEAIDETALVEYLRYGCIAPPRTMRTGAAQIHPGHTLRIHGAGDDQWTQIRYFDCNEPRPVGATFRTLIERAVERQLVADVPLGVFLSGGIDSSIIATCARRHGRVKTFSIGFDDARYDETPFAREVAKHLDTDHYEFRVTPDAASDLPKLAEVFGDPFGDSSALPTHYLSRETRKHVTVALSGDGGDELFGGYDRYRAIAMNVAPLRPLARIGKWLAQGHPKSRLTRAGRLLASAGFAEAERYRLYLAIFSDGAIANLLGEPPAPEAFIDLRWRELRRDRDAAGTALATDRVTYLPNDLLAKVDRASMLHALEVRSPFMDHDVVRAAASLRRDQLLGGGKKRMLREAFAKDLPASVFERPKMGFAVPIGEWFRTSLRSMLHEHLYAPDSFARSRLSMPAVAKLIAEHECGRIDHSQRLYALLMLELWHRSRVV